MKMISSRESGRFSRKEISVSLLTGKRVIDLTRMLQPGKEVATLDISTFFVDEVSDFHRQKGDWYIVQEWRIRSHIGTHIESPYHHLKNGKDISKLELGQTMGDAVVLDFHSKQAGEVIEIAEVQAASQDMRAGDIVLIHTGFD